MIVALIIGGYVAVGLAVGRWTALRRLRKDWGWDDADEDDQIAIALSVIFWWMAGPMYLVTRPPRPAKAERAQKRIQELERELEKEL